MPAQELASASSSTISGEPGDLYLVGRPRIAANKTSHGLKQLASIYWSIPSPLSLMLVRTSLSTETTRALLKDGGKGAIGTEQSTNFSNRSMYSLTLYPDLSKSAQSMSLANPTQLTNHPEEYMEKNTFYSLPPIFLMKSDTSSLMQWILSPPQSSAYSITGSIPLLQPKSSIEPSSDSKPLKGLEQPELKKTKSSLTPCQNDLSVQHHRFSTPLPPPSGLNTTKSSPAHYKPGLVPLPSSLRPHCLARERLCKWLPAKGNTHVLPMSSSEIQSPTITDQQLDHILEVIGSSWVDSTKETYGAGLLVFHIYCDTHNIPEEQQCPVAPTLLLVFLSTSGKAKHHCSPSDGYIVLHSHCSDL